MANTTNFGWETPDDTDLVKDGAAAIRTLGSAIDTSLADLEGGTTGQILAKNSNSDMDFVWVTNDVGDITEVVAGTGLSGGGSSGSVTLTNTVATEFDAKGDLVGGTGADTFDKLSAGTNDHRLVAASGETTGLKYVADTQNTVIDAEGDLLVGDAADAVQRLAVGTTGQVLTVDTTVDGKIKWATAAGSSGPAFLAYRATSTQSISAGTYTKVQFNAESFDTDSCFDPSSNYRFTPNKSGYYQINIKLTPYISPANFGVIRLYFNGSSVRTATSDSSAGSGQILNTSTLIYMNGSSDYLEVFIYTESASNIDAAPSGPNINNEFSGVWIRS
jgi:hypothetical protein